MTSRPANRPLALAKLRTLIDSLNLPHARVTTPYPHTLDLQVLAREAPMPDGVSVGSFRVEFRLDRSFSRAARFGHGQDPEYVEALIVKEQCLHDRKTRRYAIEDDGSFNEEKVREIIVEHARRSPEAVSEIVESRERTRAIYAQHFATAKEFADALGVPDAFTSPGLSAPYETHKPTGLSASVTINRQGTGVHLTATIQRPETLTRILAILRQEQNPS